MTEKENTTTTGDTKPGARKGNKKRTLSQRLARLALTMIVAGIIFVVWLLLKSDTSTTSVNREYETSTSAYCQNETGSGAIFNLAGASTASQVIKVFFLNDQIDKITYTLEATYRDYETADIASARMHADYDSNKKSSYQGIIAQFGTVGEKAKADLYAEAKKLEAGNVALFSLTADEWQKMQTGGVNDAKRFYEAKGYKCTINGD